MNERDKELARQAGMVYREFEDECANANTDGVDQETMQKFAALIRADEREACADAVVQAVEKGLQAAIAMERETCAKLCDDIHAEHEAKDVFSSYAEAIRARGNT